MDFFFLFHTYLSVFFIARKGTNKIRRPEQINEKLVLKNTKNDFFQIVHSIVTKQKKAKMNNLLLHS